MAARTAIVIAVDGLRASALGAYGNTWYGTPALDALAAESLVADWMYCDSPDLAGFYRRAWGANASLIDGLANAGGSATLISDDSSVVESASPFSEVLHVASESPAAASDAFETATGRLLAVAAEWYFATGDRTSDAPLLLWVHARGFQGPWDAPTAMRTALLDEGDPPAPSFVVAPEQLATDDHDELLALRAAYAAQVMVLDDCLGGFLAAVKAEDSERDLLLALVGCRGFALGEHGEVGNSCHSLYSELLHVPLLVKLPGRGPGPPRQTSLAHPCDLAALLARWFKLSSCAIENTAMDLRGDHFGDAARRVILAHGINGERALRTPEWYVRLPPSSIDAAASPPRSAELYVKPDDRWEANEVADRCPDAVELLLAELYALPQGPSFTPLATTTPQPAGSQ